MNLFNRIFNKQVIRTISCIDNKVPKTFLSIVNNSAIKMTYQEKYFIFSILIQSLENKIYDHSLNKELVDNLLVSIQLMLSVVHHTYNLPEFYNVDKDYKTGLTSIHVQYNESITQLVLLLITTKISEYVLQNNNKRYISNGEIKTINMGLIISMMSEFNSVSLKNEKTKIFKEICFNDLDYEMKIEKLDKLMELEMVKVFKFIFKFYYSLFGNYDEKKSVIEELSLHLSRMWLFVYSDNYDDLTSPMNCEKSQEIFKYNKTKTLELLVSMGLFDKDFQSLVLYLETAYLCKVRDMMKMNLNTSPIKTI